MRKGPGHYTHKGYQITPTFWLPGKHTGRWYIKDRLSWGEFRSVDAARKAIDRHVKKG